MINTSGISEEIKIMNNKHGKRMLLTYLVQKTLSSCLLSRKFKVNIYKRVVLSVTLYGCGTWSLTLREE